MLTLCDFIYFSDFNLSSVGKILALEVRFETVWGGVETVIVRQAKKLKDLDVQYSIYGGFDDIKWDKILS